MSDQDKTRRGMPPGSTGNAGNASKPTEDGETPATRRTLVGIAVNRMKERAGGVPAPEKRAPMVKASGTQPAVPVVGPRATPDQETVMAKGSSKPPIAQGSNRSAWDTFD